MRFIVTVDTEHQPIAVVDAKCLDRLATTDWSKRRWTNKLAEFFQEAHSEKVTVTIDEEE